MGVAESRNDRFYQLCGLGKTHLVERMLEADKDLKTININWQNYEVCRPCNVAFLRARLLKMAFLSIF